MLRDTRPRSAPPPGSGTQEKRQLWRRLADLHAVTCPSWTGRSVSAWMKGWGAVVETTHTPSCATGRGDQPVWSSSSLDGQSNPGHDLPVVHPGASQVSALSTTWLPGRVRCCRSGLLP